MILYQGKSSNNELFRIPMHIFPKLLTQSSSSSSAFLGKAVTSSVWHHRLGHPSNEVLEKMLRSSDISFSSNEHDIIDSAEPSTFKTASQIPQCHVAMQEEYDALQTQVGLILKDIVIRIGLQM
ncbi:uncharacterized protein [Malus domestica]|uniref:uncharacterized protein n=1 Tax=Malus domestica TaxID=3750 RepID=UPI003976D4F2